MLADGDLDLYEMANLYPTTTGLPMTVWVSPRGNAQHDARVKVSIAHGDRMDISNTAVVSIRPTPRLFSGNLGQSDLSKVVNWVSLNTDALMAYWEGKIDTIQ